MTVLEIPENNCLTGLVGWCGEADRRWIEASHVGDAAVPAPVRRILELLMQP